MHATIQVPAYHERAVDRTLEQVVTQANRLPAPWSASVEAWVTPGPGKQPHNCTTMRLAGSVPGVDVHTAPEGKLSTRNVAHNHAAHTGADVIVTWDADAPPTHDDTLRALLEPFTSEGVIAASGEPIAGGPIGAVTSFFAGVEDVVRPQMHGQLSAFRVAGWRAAGPFDTDLDETDIAEVRREEEFAFRRRLEQHGQVADVPAAMVKNDTRRVAAKISRALDRFGGYPDSPLQRDRGVVSFNRRDCGCDED